jgi:hypothetical protein
MKVVVPLLLKLPWQRNHSDCGNAYNGLRSCSGPQQYVLMTTHTKYGVEFECFLLRGPRVLDANGAFSLVEKYSP